MERWLSTVETATEGFLTRRRIRHERRREKQKRKNPILDWIQAILEAAFWVLLINQFLFQAYQIPSGSMETTLLIKDRIFVNKLVYGPELLPGIGKLPGLREPIRGDVITFENPTYLSRGTAFDLLQRILYMITFSLVDIDRDEMGNPRVHFLIKRTAGIGGDRLRFSNGNLQFKPPGAEVWIAESELLSWSGKIDHTRRLIPDTAYAQIRRSAYADAYQQSGIDQGGRFGADARAGGASDQYTWTQFRNAAMHEIYPSETKYRNGWWKSEMGWYIPEGWVFPLGDNRDNSRDARYFGPVQVKKVLGKGAFKYWPLARFGRIN